MNLVVQDILDVIKVGAPQNEENVDEEEEAEPTVSKVASKVSKMYFGDILCHIIILPNLIYP